MWDISTAGHIEAGMNSIDSAIKELDEELGLSVTADQLEYLFTTKKEYILQNADVYLITYDKTPLDLTKFKLQVEEVQDVKMINYRDLETMARNSDPTLVPLRDPSKPSLEESDYFKLFETLAKRYPQPSSSS
eukprot:gene12482-14650_t